MVSVANLEGTNLVAVRRLVRLIEQPQDVDHPDQMQALLSEHKPPKRPGGTVMPLGETGASQFTGTQAGAVAPAA